jgi:ABC-2 type transport system ATP-binding protein
MDKQFIIAENLSFTVKRNAILDGVDFAVARGDCVALVGANGCGKTTLLKMLCGLLKPTSGTLTVANLTRRNPQESTMLNNIIGFVPDTPPLYGHDTVYSYLRFKAQLHGIHKIAINPRIDAVLTQFALEQYRNARLCTLSKGTQQRVNLAQAILHEPIILLMDEPSTALDQEQCDALCTFIKQLRLQQITLLIASHDYNEMIPLCDYMLRISAGKIQQLVTPLTATEATHTHDQFDYTT